MKISKRSEYAIRALVELALHPDDRLQTSTIALAQAIPEPCLEQILSGLRRARLIRSVRGAHGGHELATNAAELRLSDLIATLEGPLSSCASMDARLDDRSAVGRPLHSVWQELQSAELRVLESWTIADLARMERSSIGGQYAI
jgi:Rrf2 family protein